MVLLLLLLPLSFAAKSKPNLIAQLDKYDPVPAEPGNLFDVWIGFDNKGSEPATNLKLRFVDVFPFSSNAGTIDIGTIPANNDFVQHMMVKTDLGALSKDYNLTFEYQYGEDSNWWIQETAQVQVRTTGASISVDSYEIKPSEITPGTTAVIAVILENTGKSIVKDIDVKVNLNMPFSPIASSNNRHIDSIKQGEKVTLEFQVATDPGAEPKVYSLPIDITFSDDRNNKYSRTTTISAPVNAKPDFIVIMDSVTKKDDKINVGFKAINKGITELKALTLKALPGQYTVTSASEKYYLGNLDADDFEVVEFELKPQANQFVFPVEITFRDTYNKDFTIKEELNVKVPEDEKTVSNFWIVAAVVIVIFVLGLFLLRRRKKK